MLGMSCSRFGQWDVQRAPSRVRSRESAAERDGSGEHEDGWEIDLSWLPKACTSCIAGEGQCTAKRRRDAVGADEQEKGAEDLRRRIEN